MPLNETTQVQYVQVAIHGKSAYIKKKKKNYKNLPVAISNTQLKNKQMLSALIWEKKKVGK